MTIDYIKDWWGVTPLSEADEGCELLCPRCNNWSVHTDWEDTEVPCEECGSHMAIRCPNCDEDFDHIWSTPFECRMPN